MSVGAQDRAEPRLRASKAAIEPTPTPTPTPTPMPTLSEVATEQVSQYFSN